ncbi:MAG: hypothetical protein E6I53_07255 [Chloroflexi bacterium]|nr:MAG: hypothetical protein E6I71_09665 [Chloroflexota bacterium]TME52071.1 MAG: hypothetical protein E6I53_07255 [Chloroflexota bacterium]
MSDVTLVSAWVGGIVGGAGVTLGVVQVVTGRMIINPRRWNWSVGEVRILGLVTAAEASILAIYSLVGGLVLSTGPSPNWVAPAWWYDVVWLIFPAIAAIPISMLLLEQHHQKRWPFEGRLPTAHR